MIISTLVVTLAVLTSLLYRRMKLRFKLLSYDYKQNDSEKFYGTDEMADAYNQKLKSINYTTLGGSQK